MLFRSERLLLVLDALKVKLPRPSACDVYVCTIGEKASETGFRITSDLRAAGIKAECDHMARSMKAQMKYAAKIGAAKVVIIGDEELQSGIAVIRDMEKSEEIKLGFGQIIEFIKEEAEA